VLGDSRAGSVIHGTTVATNALLEGRGGTVSLITDSGFEDVIEIGRQDRPSLYDPFADRLPPLVARESRYGYGSGTVREIASRIRSGEIDSVAVALLDSYSDTDRERRIVEMLTNAGVPREAIVSAGEEVGEFREFERTSTAVLTAYLRPVASAYLRALDRALIPELGERLLILGSNGGLMDPSEASMRSASILLSGPAGGVIGTAAIAGALGYHRAISFDMGGTSTDVCRIEYARPEITYERTIGGYVCRSPSVAVHTVGAGGGSIGWLDAGGGLRVGPQSAGADPGPACYLRGGTQPTITDANLVTGRLGPEIAGSLQMSLPAAREALSGVGRRLELSDVELASGMINVVESHMERAIKKVSVEEGADPRDSVLVAFGGAGGLHASAIARRLEMAAVAVPAHAGVFSAIGLLLSPPRIDVARSVLVTEDSTFRGLAVELAAQAAERLERMTNTRPKSVETVVDVRYLGQAHETPVPFGEGESWDDLADRFHRLHRQRNGFSRPEDAIEVVTVRAVATGTPAARWEQLPGHIPTGGDPYRGTREVVVDGDIVDAAIWWRPDMEPGQRISGPAVIEEPESTIFVGADERAELTESGALVIQW